MLVRIASKDINAVMLVRILTVVRIAIKDSNAVMLIRIVMLVRIAGKDSIASKDSNVGKDS